MQNNRQPAPLKRRATADQYTSAQEPTTYEDDVPDSYYNTRLPTSTRRYYDTRGNQVIEQGNRRIVFHD
jgi:hypothetical protein